MHVPVNRCRSKISESGPKTTTWHYSWSVMNQPSNDASAPPQPAQAGGGPLQPANPGQRPKVLIAAAIPILIVVVLLIWGTVRTGGQRGRPGINDTFGDVVVPTGLAKDFQLNLLDGRTMRLSDLRGKVVVVDFWASWCNPCITEGPMLAEAYDEWRGRGVEFVGISIWDQQKDVAAFVLRNSTHYANGIDDRGQVAIDYGVKGIPEKFFITADGQLARKVIGPMSRAQLDSMLDKLTLQAVSTPQPVTTTSPP